MLKNVHQLIVSRETEKSRKKQSPVKTSFQN